MMLPKPVRGHNCVEFTCLVQVANNDGLYSLNAKGRPVKYGVRTGRKVLPEPQSKVQLPGYW